jgi:hypothetical protein
MVCGCEEKLKADITAEACWEGTGGGANVPGRQGQMLQNMYQKIIEHVEFRSHNCHAVFVALNLLTSQQKRQTKHRIKVFWEASFDDVCSEIRLGLICVVSMFDVLSCIVFGRSRHNNQRILMLFGYRSGSFC